MTTTKTRASPGPPADHSSGTPSAPGPSVLLIDDQPARLLTYESILSGVGVQCVKALSGEEALKKLLEQEFAVILLDVNMPGMDGFDVARAIREHPRLERTPIIFVTGVHVSQIDQLKGYEVGGIDYIAVPIVPEILRSKVAILTELYLRRRELLALNRELSEARGRLTGESAQREAPAEDGRLAAFEHPTELLIIAKALRDASGAITDWVYLDANGAALRVMKSTREALVGRRLSEQFPDGCKRIGALYEKGSQQLKDEFLAMLAHELRNPIAPIISGAELLSRLTTTDARAQACANVIHRQARHLSRLLDDLLDVASITQRRVVLRRELISVMSCVEQAIEVAEAPIREKAQRLTVQRPPASLLINADRARIAQSIANLLLNASRYMREGGEIRVAVYSESAQAAVEVSDNGEGISADLLPRVFDLFVQGEQPLDRTKGGLGVGLAVCRELVDMHGGTVSAFSAGPHQGATFTIRLPLAGHPAEGKRTFESTADPSRRILIVDDNRDAADLLASLLESEGHQTSAVYTAMDSLEQVITFRPDIVVLDIGLPGMDGYEVAKRIKASAHPIRLIALSGYGQLEDKHRSSAAGFDAHLVKPVDLQTLKKILAAGS